MKRAAVVISLILSLCLLCGCVETEPPTATVQADASEYTAMLDVKNHPNRLSRCMDLIFESPEKVPLYWFFYNGIGHSDSWDCLSPASCAALIDHGFSTDAPLQIMPVGLLEEDLQKTFGIGLADVTIPEEWCWLGEEDAWCSRPYDSELPEDSEITAVDITDIETNTQTIIIHYTTLHTYPGSDLGWGLDQVMTLHLNTDGSVHVLSNMAEP